MLGCCSYCSHKSLIMNFSTSRYNKKLKKINHIKEVKNIFFMIIMPKVYQQIAKKNCPIDIQVIYSYYFLITYRACKKRKYCNRMSKKKIFSF